jgi:hypothetical protein
LSITSYSIEMKMKENELAIVKRSCELMRQPILAILPECRTMKFSLLILSRVEQIRPCERKEYALV